MSCLNHQARVRELWILIHHHHIPSSGSTTLTLWFKGLSLAICPTPTHALKGPAADQTAECPQAPVKAPKSCLGQGKHEPIRRRMARRGMRVAPEAYPVPTLYTNATTHAPTE
ncbi:NADH-ubiquinone oxidoreductase 9.5 kDa subunit [Fusarium oxysporum f. sp. albedinis]|nr:NADH-ubiquinone oxidoreductase 9.5 kDa subunit [Fusarium oxysporum f. sp. albedinis]